MKTVYENEFSMYLSLRDFFLSNLAAFSLLPHFEEYFEELTNSIEAIQALLEKRTLIETGALNIKPAIKEDLIVLTVDSAKKVYAFAVYAKNKAIIKQALYAKKSAKKATDSKLLVIGKMIYKLAQENLVALGFYGVTAATQLELNTAIENYVVAFPSEKNNNTESKAITSDFNLGFESAEVAIDNISLLVDTIERTNPSLFASYQSAIKVYKYGSRSYDILGQINHVDTNLGMKGVSITATLMGSDDVIFKKKSAVKGGFRGKISEDGVYVFTFRKTGFVEQTLTVAIVKGEHCVIKIKLIPVDYSSRA